MHSHRAYLVRFCHIAALGVALTPAHGCSGRISAPYSDDSVPSQVNGPAAVSGSGAAGNAPSASAAAAGSSSGASAAGASASAPQDTGMLPARIRRLTDAEFDTSVKDLLGVDSTFGASFTPDTRQDGFTRNDAQRVDPVFITQLDAAAKQLASQVKVDQLAPCANASDPSASQTCARTFLKTFATKAYRRPATDAEVEALMTVYSAGADGAAYADGIQLAVQAVLESPGFLYTTEINPTLDDYEIASAISYLLTGAPPDSELLQSAAKGELHDAAVRGKHVDRLLMTDAASKQVVRQVEEWLGIDRITETAKDSTVYPDFAGLRDAMKHEADAFVSEVMWKGGGGVSELISADWTPAEDGLARMYLDGQQPQRTDNHVSLASVRRRGILNQGAFLSVYAHAQETAPVLRGVAVLRRVACIDIPSPSSLNVNIVPPVADPQKTTRERFAIHSQDAACAGCHDKIDAIGFTFEGLDGMGKARTMENGKPVDSATTIKSGFSFDGSYPDAAALAMQLASSSEVQQCFARKLFHSAAARNTSNEKTEAAFMAQVATLPAASQGKFADVLRAFVTSDLFIQRSMQ
jgi:hypothetical protein